MATLEKIRSKSVFLLVVIGVALLAFIIGDFFTSGRTLFGNGTTIAKVAGHKIDVNEFQRRVEEAGRMQQQSGQKVDQAVLQQQVLDQMIAEALFDEEVEKLGLTVTSSELTEAMLGAGSQGIDRMVAQQTGIESAKTLHDMAFNPQKYQLPAEQAQQIRNYWIQLEKQVEEQLLGAKFQNLFAGTLVANQLDAKALYDENASTSKVNYVKKDYSTLPDDKFAVTDEEIVAEWEKHKNRYKLEEETRSVSYIAVDVVPSQADLQAGKKLVDDALKALQANEGTSGLEGMNGFITDRNRVASSMLRDQQLKKFADSAAVNQAAVISNVGNNYTLAKLMGKTTEVDSVNVDFLAVQGTKTQVDSIINVLNNGAKWADVAASPLIAQSQDSLWISMVDPNSATIKDVIESAETGRYFTPDTVAGQQVSRVIRVRNRRPATSVYDLAVVTYTVDPSQATRQALFDALQKYIDQNPTAADFAANAAKSNYTAVPAQVTPSTPMLGNLFESRDMVAWAMDAKKGQVSPIFGEDDSNDRLVAVALNDVYEDYISAQDPQLKNALQAQVRNDKKAASMISQYKGKAKDMPGYAALMQSKVDTTTVTFGQIFIPGIGAAESELTARVATAKPNTIVGPVKANNGVVVFTVTGVDASGRPYSFEEAAAQYMQQRGAGALGNNIANILRGNNKIDNNILDFFNRRD